MSEFDFETCQICQLLAVQKGACRFCGNICLEERTDSVFESCSKQHNTQHSQLETLTTDPCTRSLKEPSRLDSSLHRPSSGVSYLSSKDAQRDQGVTSPPHSRVGGVHASDGHKSSVEGEVVRTPGRTSPSQCHVAEGQISPVEPGGQEEGHPSRVPDREGDPCRRLRHDSQDVCQGRGGTHQTDSCDSSGPGGLRRMGRSDLRSGAERAPGLHEVGNPNLQGGRYELAPQQTGSVGRTADQTSPTSYDKTQWLCEDTSWEAIPYPSRRFLRKFVRADSHIGGAVHRGGASPGTREGEAREGRSGSDGRTSEVSEGHMSDLEHDEHCCLAHYPEQQCLERHRKIGRAWRQENNPYGRTWQELNHFGRLFMLEVACNPDSLLSSEVEKQLGSGASMRCSLFNGYDLTTKEGVSKICDVIAELKPVHIWISCDCGPYSPLQRLNQRTPSQVDALEKKRAYALKEYLGGIQVAKCGTQHGAQVHWELSERCEAWKLTPIVNLTQELRLQKVTTHGCTVNLRARDTGELMCKGWTVATANTNLLRHLHLPCQRNHKKTVCESGRPLDSASYTPVFVRKVVEALRQQEMWSLVCDELNEPLPAESSEEQTVESLEQCLVNVPETSPEERDRILKLVKHIHCTSGHGSLTNLLRALQKRGVAPHVLAVAKTFSCSICDERKRIGPRRPATLETIPKKWQVVQSDMGSWVHPYSKDKCKFILFIDEGCRFRAGKILFMNNRNMATWSLVKQVFEEHWLSHFGQPEVLRADPEGVWRDTEAAEWCGSRGIELSTIPAEAHWQIGIVENAIKGVKAVMSAMAEEFHDMSLNELFCRAIWVSNSKDNHRGYSPLQHAMGRSPDEWGHLFESKIKDYPIHPQEMADGGFAENIRAMAVAEQQFSEFQAGQRLARAQAAGNRPLKSFCPGDLVFYWRKQVPGGAGKGFSWTGQFVGPARVLATETRVEEDGSLRAGSIVWLHHAGRLLKAAPEQLRGASEREQAIEELKGPLEIPWTISSLAAHPNRRTYHDISRDIPSNADFEDAANRPIHPTGGLRHTQKKRPIDSGASSSQASTRRISIEGEAGDPHMSGIASANLSEENNQAFEISFELPTSKRGLQRFMESPEAYVVSQLKRSTTEVKERALTDSELLQFKEAKGKEVRNYIQSQCFKVLPSRVQEQVRDAVGMRWVLTWKSLQDGSQEKKAKARCVILGYQDKSYEYKQTSSPTLSRTGRQAFLLFCSQHHFRIQKGDVSSAFLQGDLLQDGMHVMPTDEICRVLGIPEGSITKLQRAAYGLVEAPLWWYKSVSSFLVSIGYTRLKSEPCIWVYFDSEHKPRSIISGHVDDFLFGGTPNDELHERFMKQIQQKFSWGTWENTPFVQCGVRVSQDEKFGFHLEQHDFIQGLRPIYLSNERMRKHDDFTTDAEKTQLRAVLGSLSWLCGQTDYVHSADVGFLISQVPHSRISDLLKANALVDDIKRDPISLKVHPLPKGEPLDIVAWADAAWANRPDNVNSTGGIVIGGASRSLRDGVLTPVSLLAWHSYKIDRNSRSPACAETHAVVDAEDELYHVRYMWSELQHSPDVLRSLSPQERVRLVPGILITDSKNFYDKLNKDTPVVKGAERRADLEALTVKDSMEETDLMLRWVHSDAQLANSGTKPSEKHQIVLFRRLGQRWRIIYDPEMVSAKRRKALGLPPMVQCTNTTKHT